MILPIYNKIDIFTRISREFLLNSDFTETYSKNTIPPKASDAHKPENNVRIDLYPEYSIDEGYDALEYEDCNKSRIDKLKRQRSYSVDDSVSIVFENPEATNETPSRSDHPKIDESDNSSYIQFASDSHNTIDIDNPGSVSNIDDENVTSSKDTRVVCINESKSKKGHRRNFSLDSKKSKTKKPRETVYLYIQMQLCQEESLRDWLQKNQDVEVRKNIVSIRMLYIF